jgi:hypothetical protein
MRRPARFLMSTAAILAASVPAAAGVLRGAHAIDRARTPPGAEPLIPAHALPSGAGFGAGTWRLPAAGSGYATAELRDPSGRLRYVVRADLVRSPEFPPEGMPEQGGFQGVLLAVRGRVREPVAQVSGTWILEPDGTGAMGAAILAPSEDVEHPLVEIGRIDGVLRAPRAVSWLVPVRATGHGGAATLARFSSTWAIGE